MGVLTVVLAVAVGFAIWWVGTYALRALSAIPPEIDPDDVVEVEQAYRCSVCGTQVTMTVVNVAEAKPPKHCREEMVPLG